VVVPVDVERSSPTTAFQPPNWNPIFLLLPGLGASQIAENDVAHRSDLAILNAITVISSVSNLRFIKSSNFTFRVFDFDQADFHSIERSLSCETGHQDRN
jgi:hypothetical protein